MLRYFKIYSLCNLQMYNTVLLTIVARLYINLSTTCFLTGSLYILTPFAPFMLPHLWQPPVCSLHLWAWFFLLDSTYNWECIVFVWLTFLIIMPFRVHPVVENVYISFFLWLNNIHNNINNVCIYVGPSLYSWNKCHLIEVYDPFNILFN